MSDAWDFIAEMRIQKAVDRGELCNPGGAGRAVEVTDDFSIPWTVRWLLKKSREGHEKMSGPFQAKAIAAKVLKGEIRRAQLTRLVQQAKRAKAEK